MRILNFSRLAKNDLRKTALRLAEAAYEAIDIRQTVNRRIKNEGGVLKIFGHDGKNEYEKNLSPFGRVILIGIGKGAYEAVRSARKILKKRIYWSAALDSRHISFEKIKNFFSNRFFICEGTHPFPSEKNVKATKKIMRMVETLTEKDLLISIICGGGSSLACESGEEARMSSYAIKELTRRGADIEELNVVRKHLSHFKGGGLSRIAYPATVISLIISDVCGNDLSMVASGPTVMDKTTKEDAENVLKKYGIEKDGLDFLETPKDKTVFEKTENILFVCNEDVIFFFFLEARRMGIRSGTHSLTLKGEAKSVFLPMIAKNESGAILAAGETTITFNTTKPGKGGRSMESVLGVIDHFQEKNDFPEDLVIFSLASDGRDNTDSAGAIADRSTSDRARYLNIDVAEKLKTHNTYEFFQKTGDAVFTSQESFNVADFMLVLRK